MVSNLAAIHRMGTCGKYGNRFTMTTNAGTLGLHVRFVIMPPLTVRSGPSRQGVSRAEHKAKPKAGAAGPAGHVNFVTVF